MDLGFFNWRKDSLFVVLFLRFAEWRFLRWNSQDVFNLEAFWEVLGIESYEWSVEVRRGTCSLYIGSRLLDQGLDAGHGVAVGKRAASLRKHPNRVLRISPSFRVQNTQARNRTALLKRSHLPSRAKSEPRSHSHLEVLILKRCCVLGLAQQFLNYFHFSFQALSFLQPHFGAWPVHNTYWPFFTCNFDWLQRLFLYHDFGLHSFQTIFPELWTVTCL